MLPLDIDYAPDAFEVKVSELLVATAEQGDALIDRSVPDVLRLLREHLQMDVVFISEFVDGQRVYRRVDAAPGRDVIRAGESDPLEQTFCQRVVDGRLPQAMRNTAVEGVGKDLPAFVAPVGAYLSVPVVLNDGRVYGTLCCFSANTNEKLTQRDLKKLEMSAQLAARRIEAERAKEAVRMTREWSLEPLATPGVRR